MIGVNAARENRPSPRRVLAGFVIHVILIAGAIAMVLPFYWMLITSVKEPAEIFTQTIKWFPSRFVWANYVEAWSEDPYFWRYFGNTTFIAVATTILQLLTSALAAYAFATMDFFGKEVIFLLFLGTMMIPGQLLVVPNYVLIYKLGWYDTYYALIIPWIASVFSIFMMRQFFMTIPKELWDAAQIDGCSRFWYLWRVIMPLSKPVFITSGLFTFIGSWNSFLWPLIATSNPALRTIQVGLNQFNQEFGTQPHLLMAASTVAIVPIVVLFFFAQKQFIQGIARTGLKS